MVRDRLDEFADFLVGIAFLAGGLLFAGILGYQAYYWIRVGEWLPLPISIAFEFFNVDLSHIYNPADWHGLAKVAEWLLSFPISICSPVLVISLAVFIKTFVTTDGFSTTSN